MANISFGQRQLIVGNNKVGKTTLLSNIAKNFSINKNFSYLNVKNTYSFYSFIGSSRREFILHKSCHYFLNKKSNFFVDGTVSLDLYSQFISPFTVIFFCEQLSLNGLDTVHILDSLSNHAKIYRNMMLDLKRSPGREAYPGDIFYLHAKILEKYGQSSYCYNLGSMTGLPVTEIQKNNISDYITTNLISITDGQWFLSSLLRAKGMYPCLDINLSVSRIGNISHNSMLKYLGTVIRALVSEYTVLQEAQLFMSLDKIKLKRYLQSCKMYNTFFWGAPLSYLSIVFLVLYTMYSSNFFWCRSEYTEEHYSSSIYDIDFSIVSTFIYWSFSYSNTLVLDFIETYFCYLFVFEGMISDD